MESIRVPKGTRPPMFQPAPPVGISGGPPPMQMMHPGMYPGMQMMPPSMYPGMPPSGGPPQFPVAVPFPGGNAAFAPPTQPGPPGSEPVAVPFPGGNAAFAPPTQP